MKKRSLNTVFSIFLVLGMVSCVTSNNKNGSNTSSNDSNTVKSVESTHFTSANPNTKTTTVPCTLSDGTETECLQIVTNSTPTDHQMGPWCPDNISDDASAGGIWLKDGEVYDVDGEFIKSLATLYDDSNWQMYDTDGNVYVTKTKEDCINAANPNVGDEYKNFCVECIPSHITSISRTWLIPITPVLQDKPTAYRGPGGGGRPDRPKGDRPPRPEGQGRPDAPPPHGPEGAENGTPSTRGIALNGVEFSAPAPLNNILSAYTIAPFDDAGGHINVHQGYHYHTATGVSYSIKQTDGHAPLIGYAMDGHGIYGRLDADGNEPSDLDDCRGHYDEVRGYHYHVDAAGNNNFINCLQGAYAK